MKRIVSFGEITHFKRTSLKLLRTEFTAGAEMNLTKNTTYEGYQELSYLDIAFGSYACVVSVLGVISNLLIIFTIGFGKHVGKQVKIQLIHLAVVDLLWSVLYLAILWTERFNLIFLTTTTGCKLYIFVAFASLLASPLTSAAMSIERVFIIYFPFKAVLYRDIHKYIMIAIIWLCASSTQIPFILKTDITYYDGLPHCGTVVDSPYLHWTDVLSYCIPVFVVIISYSLVFIKLCIRKRSHISHQSTAQPQSRIDKVLPMLFVDALVTILTWMPEVINDLLGRIIPNFDYNENYYAASEALSYLFITNTFTSFIIYSIFNNNFRMDLRLLFHRIHQKLTSSVDTSTDRVSTDLTLNTF